MDDKDDLLSASIGTGCLSFGIYCWMPPMIRFDYISLGFLTVEPKSKIDEILAFIRRDIDGLLFAGATGALTGVGYDAIGCDSSDKEGTRYQRVRQVALGLSTFVAGLYAVSPTVLKLVWLADIRD
jgi:hypothetical protein